MKKSKVQNKQIKKLKIRLPKGEKIHSKLYQSLKTRKIAKLKMDNITRSFIIGEVKEVVSELEDGKTIWGYKDLKSLIECLEDSTSKVEIYRWYSLNADDKIKGKFHKQLIYKSNVNKNETS